MADRTRLTHRKLKEILPGLLSKVGQRASQRPDLVVAAWPEVIGPRLAPMTQAVGFEEGVLTVKVRNSTLYSLLRTHEGGKLLRKLRERFPRTAIRSIAFRIG